MEMINRAEVKNASSQHRVRSYGPRQLYSDYFRIQKGGKKNAFPGSNYII